MDAQSCAPPFAEHFSREPRRTWMTTTYENDKRLAERLDLSTSWVRKQRWLRRHGEEHVLNIDPIMIGVSPRYKIADIEAWLESLGGAA